MKNTNVVPKLVHQTAVTKDTQCNKGYHVMLRGENMLDSSVMVQFKIKDLRLKKVI